MLNNELWVIGTYKAKQTYVIILITILIRRVTTLKTNRIKYIASELLRIYGNYKNCRLRSVDRGNQGPSIFLHCYFGMYT